VQSIGLVGDKCQHSAMAQVFIGSEALAAGRLTRHELQRWHRRIYPDVYLPKGCQASLRERTVGAWLWSRRRAVVAGVAASALLGAPYVDDDVPIELVWHNGRPPDGLIIRNDALRECEVTRAVGLPVTSVERTAFDLGRLLPRDTAIARLDALMWSRKFEIDKVMRLAQRHPRATGIRRLTSPKETWLRLAIVDAGFAPPATQIPVHDRRGLIGWVDMGYAELRIALEYDGDHHRRDRRQYVKDHRRLRRLEAAGWIVIRVIAEDAAADVIRRLEHALRRRGVQQLAG
jgi:very-short-patch-repair endonuclease